MKPIIVSYYTLNSPYEKEIQSLIESAKRFNLEMHIKGISSLGSWEKNCCFKPLFLLQTLLEYKRPILWLDADAVIVKEPIECDKWHCLFATRINAELDLTNPSKCITGTVYLKYDPIVIDILTAWKDECDRQLKENDPPIWDQICLRDVLIKKNLFHLVMPIPLSYGAIIHHEEEMKDPVIVHTQASRTYKSLMDGNVNPSLFQELNALNAEELKQFREQRPDC